MLKNAFRVGPAWISDEPNNPKAHRIWLRITPRKSANKLGDAHLRPGQTQLGGDFRPLCSSTCLQKIMIKLSKHRLLFFSESIPQESHGLHENSILPDPVRSLTCTLHTRPETMTEILLHRNSQAKFPAVRATEALAKIA